MRAGMKSVGILFLFTTLVWAENWPHWRGPGRDGVSPEKNLPVEWSATENVTWKVPMAAWSGATPIVWGDHLFLNAAEGGKRKARGPAREEEPDPKAEGLALWCLDRNSGKTRWKRSLGGGNRQMQKQNMSSPSPVTDGLHVWVMTGTGIVKSFDFKGKEVWARDIQADYGEFGLGWGYGS